MAVTTPQIIISPLRISTTVTTCHTNSGIRLKRLFDNFSKWAIPFGYPGEGFLKMEFESKVTGSSTRDVLTKRRVTEKTFFNQATLVIRKKLPVTIGNGWKEVNIKLFANGGVQMTGIPTPEFSQEAITYVINEIKAKDQEVFTGDAAMIKFRIQLINSDYSINRHIYQDKLHKLLSNTYNLFSSHESTIYQGVNTKYYYNKRSGLDKLRPGICQCTAPCNGQGNGNGDGECKRITISPFSSGKIIITGARDMDQINEAYIFFNKILNMHQEEILFTAPVPAMPVAPIHA